ncbi:hypothetical protein CCMA1212_002928 [Trichoderma ghanense]|uniref:Uncharacterized protein n=1 Tax=Trichoderma ghanense TaxID=65468 RepID=A0ABY2H903_9HYPO
MGLGKRARAAATSPTQRSPREKGRVIGRRIQMKVKLRREGGSVMWNPWIECLVTLAREAAEATRTAGATRTALLPLQGPAVTSLLLVLCDFRSGLILGHSDVLGPYPRKDLGGFGGILAPGADLGAVLPEEKGEGNAGQRQEGRNGTRPVDTQVLVHVAGEERESSAKERSEDGAGSQSRGGEDDI